MRRLGFYVNDLKQDTRILVIRTRGSYRMAEASHIIASDDWISLRNLKMANVELFSNILPYKGAASLTAHAQHAFNIVYGKVFGDHFLLINLVIKPFYIRKKLRYFVLFINQI